MITQNQDLFSELDYLKDWVNGVFISSWKTERVTVDNLIPGIRNGLLLIKLTNALLCLKLPILHQNPTSVIQRMDNIEMCLEVLEDHEKYFTGFISKDLAEGDVELILAFCRALQREFYLGFPSSSFSKLPEGNISKLSSLAPGKRYYLTSPGTRPPHSWELPPSSILYDKSDISALNWITTLTGEQITSYDKFLDGTLLCQVVNNLLPGSIPPQVVRRSSSRERLDLVLNIAKLDLGLGPTLSHVDACRNVAEIQKVIKELQQLHEPSKLFKSIRSTSRQDPSFVSSHSSQDMSVNSSRSWKPWRSRGTRVSCPVGRRERPKSWPEEISFLIPDITYSAKDLSIGVQESIDLERKLRIKKIEKQLEHIRERLKSDRSALKHTSKHPRAHSCDALVATTPARHDVTISRTSLAGKEFTSSTPRQSRPPSEDSVNRISSSNASSSILLSNRPATPLTEVTHDITRLARLCSRRPEGAIKTL